MGTNEEKPVDLHRGVPRHTLGGGRGTTQNLLWHREVPRHMFKGIGGTTQNLLWRREVPRHTLGKNNTELAMAMSKRKARSVT